MNSIPTVLPSPRTMVRRRPDEDIATFYVIELFILVAFLDALLIAFAAPVISDIASLYATAT